MADLLKLKPKPDKTMTVVAIDRIKQKSLGSTGLVTVKVMDQPYKKLGYVFYMFCIYFVYVLKNLRFL